MDRDQAAAALAGVDSAQERLAQQVGMCPPWRHAALGLVMAILVGGASLELPLQMMSVPIAMALIVAIFLYDRRRFGVFINGYRRGATLPLTLALAGAMVVLMVASITTLHSLNTRDGPTYLIAPPAGDAPTPSGIKIKEPLPTE